MTKRIMKILAVVLTLLMVVAISGSVFATEVDINAFKTYADTSGASTSITRVIGAIINVVQVVGAGVAIIMLTVIAIKYISAAPGDKADIKKHAVVYIVGAVVLFAATGILEIIKNFAGNVKA